MNRMKGFLKRWLCFLLCFFLISSSVSPLTALAAQETSDTDERAYIVPVHVYDSLGTWTSLISKTQDATLGMSVIKRALVREYNENGNSRYEVTLQYNGFSVMEVVQIVKESETENYKNDYPYFFNAPYGSFNQPDSFFNDEDIENSKSRFVVTEEANHYFYQMSPHLAENSMDVGEITIPMEDLNSDIIIAYANSLGQFSPGKYVLRLETDEMEEIPASLAFDAGAKKMGWSWFGSATLNRTGGIVAGSRDDDKETLLLLSKLLESSTDVTVDSNGKMKAVFTFKQNKEDPIVYFAVAKRKNSYSEEANENIRKLLSQEWYGVDWGENLITDSSAEELQIELEFEDLYDIAYIKMQTQDMVDNEAASTNDLWQWCYVSYLRLSQNITETDNEDIVLSSNGVTLTTPAGSIPDGAVFTCVDVSAEEMSATDVRADYRFSKDGSSVFYKRISLTDASGNEINPVYQVTIEAALPDGYDAENTICRVIPTDGTMSDLMSKDSVSVERNAVYYTTSSVSKINATIAVIDSGSIMSLEKMESLAPGSYRVRTSIGRSSMNSSHHASMSNQAITDNYATLIVSEEDGKKSYDLYALFEKVWVGDLSGYLARGYTYVTNEKGTNLSRSRIQELSYQSDDNGDLVHDQFEMRSPKGVLFHLEPEATYQLTDECVWKVGFVVPIMDSSSASEPGYENTPQLALLRLMDTEEFGETEMPDLRYNKSALQGALEEAEELLADLDESDTYYSVLKNAVDNKPDDYSELTADEIHSRAKVIFDAIYGKAADSSTALLGNGIYTLPDLRVYDQDSETESIFSDFFDSAQVEVADDNMTVTLWVKENAGDHLTSMDVHDGIEYIASEKETDEEDLPVSYTFTIPYTEERVVVRVRTQEKTWLSYLELDLGFESAETRSATDEDKQALRDKIAEAKALWASDYTAESYANLTAAISMAEAILEIDESSYDKINAQIQSIDAAIAGLVTAGNTVEKLTLKIQEMRQVWEDGQGVYVQSGLDNLYTAIESAESTAASNPSTVKITMAVNKLNTAYKALVPYVGLEDGSYSMPLSLYRSGSTTESTFAGYVADSATVTVSDGKMTVLLTAQEKDGEWMSYLSYADSSDPDTWLEAEPVQTDSDGHATKYRFTLDYTEEKIPLQMGNADYTADLDLDFANAVKSAAATEAEIQALQDKVTEVKALWASDYTTESYAKLASAISDAEAILAKEEPGSEEVTTQLEVLKTAQAGLVTSGSTVEKLTLKIEEMRQVWEDGQGVYVQSGLDNLYAAIESAESTAASNPSTVKITLAINKLNTAYKALVPYVGLEDGSYSIPLSLYRSGSTTESTFVGYLTDSATVTVSDGKMSVILTAQEKDDDWMSYLSYADPSDPDTWLEAEAVQTDSDGHATKYRFTLDYTEEKIPLQMGNADYTADLDLDFANAVKSAAATEAEIQALQDKVTEVKALWASDYTTESYAKLASAISDAEAILAKEEPGSEEVTTQLEVLKTAQAGLVTSGSTVEKLTLKIEEMRQVWEDGQGIYVQGTLDNLYAAIENGESVLALAKPTTVKITTAINKLNTAYKALVPYVGLEDGSYSMPLSLYRSGSTTESTFAGYVADSATVTVSDGKMTVLLTAQEKDGEWMSYLSYADPSDPDTWLEAEAVQKDSDSHATKYRFTLDYTEEKIPLQLGNADYTADLDLDFANAVKSAAATEAEIQALQDKVTEVKALWASDYTTESYAKLASAISDAEAILAKEEPGSEEVTTQLEVLKTAQAGLVTSGSTVEKLTLKIEEMRQVWEDGQGIYVQGTLDNLYAAIENGESVLALAKPTTVKITMAINKLNIAYSALVPYVGLEDGKYTIPLTVNQSGAATESSFAGYLADSATITVSDGKLTVLLTAQELDSEYSESSWMEYLNYADPSDADTWLEAEIVKTDSEGHAIQYRFTLDYTEERIPLQLGDEDFAADLDLDFENVVLISADKTKLVQAIETAEADLQQNEEQYTVSSVKAVRDILEKAKALNDSVDAEQEAVDQMTTDVEAAVKTLEKRADIEALKIVRDQAEEILENDSELYTTDSVEELRTVAEEADKAIADTSDLSQAEADALKNRLESKIDGLVRDLDLTALNQKLDEAEEILANTELNYTEGSKKVLSDVIAEVKEALEDTSRMLQSEADTFLNQLSEAIDGLEEDLDLEELSRMLEEAENLLADEDANYTEESLEALNDVVNEVKEALEDTSALVQTDIDDLLKKLTDAINALEEGRDPDYEESLEELSALIERLEQKVTDDYEDIYEPTSYEAFLSVYDLAVLITENEYYLTADQVELVTVALEEAENSLVRLTQLANTSGISLLNLDDDYWDADWETILEEELFEELEEELETETSANNSNAFKESASAVSEKETVSESESVTDEKETVKESESVTDEKETAKESESVTDEKETVKESESVTGEKETVKESEFVTDEKETVKESESVADAKETVSTVDEAELVEKAETEEQEEAIEESDALNDEKRSEAEEKADEASEQDEIESEENEKEEEVEAPEREYVLSRIKKLTYRVSASVIATPSNAEKAEISSTEAETVAETETKEALSETATSTSSSKKRSTRSLLQEGTYEVNFNLRHFSEEKNSMGNDALVKPATLIIEDLSSGEGMLYITFTEMTSDALTDSNGNALKGRLLDFYLYPSDAADDGYISDAESEAKETPEYIRRTSGKADSLSGGREYLDVAGFPVTLYCGDIPVEVNVPIMGSVGAVQNALVRINWNSMSFVSSSTEFEGGDEDDGDDEDEPIVYDTEELEEAIAEFDEVEKAEYTYSSYLAYQKSIYAGETLLEADWKDQVMIDNRVAAIKAMRLALIPVPSETEINALQNQIDSISDLDESLYTEESYLALLDSYKEAMAVLADRDATSGLLTKQLAELQKAVNNLEEVKEDDTVTIRTSTLKFWMEEAQELVDAGAHSVAELRVLKALISEAEELIALASDNNVTQEEVNALAEQIKNAVQEMADAVDFDGLDALMEQYEVVIKNKDLYTSDSILNLMMSYVEVKEIRYKSGVTQDEITAAEKTLRTAISSLVRKTDNNTDSEVDTSELELYIKMASMINSANYTAASYATLQNALTAAQTAMLSSDLTQKQADSYAKILSNAYSGLVLNTSSSSSNGSSDDSDDDKSGSDEDDGYYEVNVRLWHATMNKASMGDPAIVRKAYVHIDDGDITMRLQTKKMTTSGITTHLYEFYIYNDGDYEEADLISTENSKWTYEFPLPNDNNTYYKCKVDPRVDVMGDDPVKARLKVDWDSLDEVDEDDWDDLEGDTDDDDDDDSSTSSSSGTGSNTTLTSAETGIRAAGKINGPGYVLEATRISSGSQYDMTVNALSDADTNQFVLYDVKLRSGNTYVQPTSSVTLSIPIPAGYDSNKLVMYRINEDGTKGELTGRTNGSYFETSVDHFSLFALAESNQVKAAAASSAGSASSGSSGSTKSTTTGTTRSSSSGSKTGSSGSKTSNSRISAETSVKQIVDGREIPYTGDTMPVKELAGIGMLAVLVCLSTVFPKKKREEEEMSADRNSRQMRRQGNL